MCGWWFDICSLPMFGISFKDRLTDFYLTPGTSIISHWFIGVVFVYYFVNFALIVQEIVRPGVLEVLRNIIDPDLSIQVLSLLISN